MSNLDLHSILRPLDRLASFSWSKEIFDALASTQNDLNESPVFNTDIVNFFNVARDGKIVSEYIKNMQAYGVERAYETLRMRINILHSKERKIIDNGVLRVVSKRVATVRFNDNGQQRVQFSRQIHFFTDDSCILSDRLFYLDGEWFDENGVRQEELMAYVPIGCKNQVVYLAASKNTFAKYFINEKRLVVVDESQILRTKNKNFSAHSSITVHTESYVLDGRWNRVSESDSRGMSLCRETDTLYYTERRDAAADARVHVTICNKTLDINPNHLHGRYALSSTPGYVVVTDIITTRERVIPSDVAIDRLCVDTKGRVYLKLSNIGILENIEDPNDLVSFPADRKCYNFSFDRKYVQMNTRYVFCLLSPQCIGVYSRSRRLVLKKRIVIDHSSLDKFTCYGENYIRIQSSFYDINETDKIRLVTFSPFLRGAGCLSIVAKYLLL